jgi:hypothetical protein
MGRNSSISATITAGLVSLFLTVPAGSSDLPLSPVTLSAAVHEKALLYKLRAAFDVVDESDIPDLLADDARRFASAGVSAEEKQRLLNDLLAEGSYYIVSLDYLISAGGPNWPLDKAASAYESEAASALATLRYNWLEVTSTTTLAGERFGEMYDILQQVDQINAWTEGQLEVTPELDHFAGTAELAADAIKLASE